jgi:hypothetical protein
MHLLVSAEEGPDLRQLALVLHRGVRDDARLEDLRVLREIVADQANFLLGSGLPLLVVPDEDLPAFSLDLVEELLGVTPDLRARPGDNILLHALPVLAKKLEG